MSCNQKLVIAIRYILTDDDPVWHLWNLFHCLGYEAEPKEKREIGCGIYEKVMEVKAPSYVCKKVFGDMLRLQSDGTVTGVVTLYIKEES